MDTRNDTQRTITEIALDDHLEVWVEAFYLDRRAAAKSPGTLKFYRVKLQNFITFCETRAITRISQLTADDLRHFLLHLQDTDHTAGGVHAHYRTVKAFLRWYESEAEPDGWKNPIRKVKIPKVAQPPLEPVDLADIKALLKVCGDDYHGHRDRALFLALLDTGARASELLALNLDDIDPITGAVVIRSGKGGKSRTVFIGKAARKAVRKYLNSRTDHTPALWVAMDGSRLEYDGLRAIVTRRAAAAGITAPSLHAFRRAFALNCLRAGMDVYSLQKLMGHADLQVLRRYLAQTTDDLQTAHTKFSPGDRL